MARRKKALPARKDRFYPESLEDNRTRYQRDRDRILYTSAFRRLAGVTQVASADEGHVFHNRLTHTLEVAQVARRIAERLLTAYAGKSEQPDIDPDVAEGCALAHDLGHPPFGHIAEKELDLLISNPAMRGFDPDGFEGNAQSFRIVTRLALRTYDYDGLNLTRATLNGIIKYPWLREGRIGKSTTVRVKQKFSNKPDRNKKWAAYRSEREHFIWARELTPSTEHDTPSLEAQIMDWADDITYAVHDVSDFFRAGLVPLDRLGADSEDERDRFFDGTFDRTDWLQGFSRSELISSFDKLRRLFPLRDRYSGSNEHRRALRLFTSGLIGECVTGVQLDSRNSRLVIPNKNRKEIIMLKQLTWHYVIINAALATKQLGQKRIIRELFDIFHAATVRGEPEIFPVAYRELLEQASNARERTRLVSDMIAGMTEQQAINIHHKLSGINLGSVLDPLSR